MLFKTSWGMQEKKKREPNGLQAASVVKLCSRKCVAFARCTEYRFVFLLPGF